MWNGQKYLKYLLIVLPQGSINSPIFYHNIIQKDREHSTEHYIDPVYGWHHAD